MKEKVVIITGANSGIGKAAATKFAKEGHRVIMACRNIEGSRRIQQEIIDLTNNEKVDLMKLDISSFKSIQECCSEFKTKYKKLDVLIHNAGYFNHGEKIYKLSPDNIELTFATNTYGPLLMTKLLLDILSVSNNPRILNACTTNIRHFFEQKRKIEFENLQGEFKENRGYNAYKMYGDSKMALLMLTFKMAEEYRNLGIKVNAIQIPVIRMSKDTMKKVKSFWRVAAVIQNTFVAQSPESMGDTYYHICTSEEFKDITGKLINDKREIVQSSYYHHGVIPEIKQFFDKRVYPKYADDSDVIEKVWEFGNELISKKLIT
jgi:NAD(P)-dependent dehydrogenase (short-subunit alcohol dehydrogenase family)